MIEGIFTEQVLVNGYKFTLVARRGVLVESTYPKNLSNKDFVKSFQIAMQMYRDWQCFLDCIRDEKDFLSVRYPNIHWDNNALDYIHNFRHQLENDFVETVGVWNKAKESKPASTPWQEDNKPGYIYIIQASDPDRYYKIGYSKNPKHRIQNMGVKLPFEVKPIHLIETNHMILVEHYLHSKYQSKRARGEWFELTPDDVADLCAIDTLNAEDIA